MFSQTAQYYDTIYLAMKDYRAEADTLTAFIHQYRRSTGTVSWMLPVGLGSISPTSNGSRSRDSILMSSYSPSLINAILTSRCTMQI